jgi:hypothetical protein
MRSLMGAGGGPRLLAGLGSPGEWPGRRGRRCRTRGVRAGAGPSGAAVAGHWAESVPSPPPTASAGSPAFVPSTVSLDARRAGNPGALLRRVNCCLLSGAMDPPSHWSVTTRIPDPAPVTPAVEILWRSGVNWRITRIELWIGLWVKKFLPELAGKSCQARRRDDKK